MWHRYFLFSSKKKKQKLQHISFTLKSGIAHAFIFMPCIYNIIFSFSAIDTYRVYVSYLFERKLQVHITWKSHSHIPLSRERDVQMTPPRCLLLYDDINNIFAKINMNKIITSRHTKLEYSQKRYIFLEFCRHDR